MSLKTPTQMDYTAPYVLGQIREFIFSDSLIDLETFFVKEFDNIADDVNAMNILFNDKTIVDIILNNDLYMEKVFSNSKMISGMIPESLLFNKCLNNKAHLSKLLSLPEATTNLYADLIASEKILCAIFGEARPYSPNLSNTSSYPSVKAMDSISGVIRFSDGKTTRYYGSKTAESTTQGGPGGPQSVSKTIRLDLTKASKLIWYTNFSGYSNFPMVHTITINEKQVLKKTSYEPGYNNNAMVEYELDVTEFTGVADIVFQTRDPGDRGPRQIGAFMAINRFRLEV